MELVNSFRTCTSSWTKQHPLPSKERGKYAASFEMGHQKPHVRSFDLDGTLSKELGQMKSDRCKSIAIKSADKTIASLIQNPKSKAALEYSNETIVYATGTIYPTAEADITSSAGQILIHIPAPGMEWK